MDGYWPEAFGRLGLSPGIADEIDRLLLRAGETALILQRRGVPVSRKQDDQLVTPADQVVEAVLMEGLRGILAGIPARVRGEEGGGFDTVSDDPCFLSGRVDPIDGTRGFVLGGLWAVCVGLLACEAGRVTAGVGWTLIPGQGGLFRGAVDASGGRAGWGAGTAVTAASPLHRLSGGAYVAISSRGAPAWVARSARVVNFGSTGTHAALVTRGDAEIAAVAATRYKPHDLLAGVILATACGCRAYQLPGRPRRPLDTLRLLQRLDDGGDEFGPPLLLCTPGVAADLAALVGRGPGR